MKTLIVLTVLFFLANYSMNSKKIGFNKHTTSVPKADTSKFEKLPNGSFYRFVYLTKFKYKIEWGSKEFKNISKDTFELS
ncbi:MAG TPA: hypothetical protein VGK38_11725, partial [Prolixibacteraceae bacterium]